MCAALRGAEKKECKKKSVRKDRRRSVWFKDMNTLANVPGSQNRNSLVKVSQRSGTTGTNHQFIKKKTKQVLTNKE